MAVHGRTLKCGFTAMGQRAKITGWKPHELVKKPSPPCPLLARGIHYRLSPMAKHTPHQDRIIRRYYQNQDQLLVQRLGDLVTDLYLAEGKNRVRLWKRTAEILEKLKIPNDRVQHVCQSDNPALVAEVLKELLEKE